MDGRFGSAVYLMTPDVTRLDLNFTGSGSPNVTGLTGTLNAYIDGAYGIRVGPSTGEPVALPAST